MKKNIYYFFLAFALFAGCTKKDGPLPVDVERVPEPQLLRMAGARAIDATNLASFQGIFDVDLYFSSDVPPSKFDVVVRKNNDNSNVKVFKTDISTFPTTVTITESDFVALFGTATVLGDSYDISVDVYTQSGKKYEAFPVVGAGYGSGIAQQPGASTSVNYKAICQYHDDVYQGNFVVLQDDWADFSPGEVVTITRIDASHFSFIDPYAVSPTPVIVTVDPLYQFSIYS